MIALAHYVILKIRGGSEMLKLQTQWQARLKLWAEGDKLWAKAQKLRAKAQKLRAESDKLRAEAIIETYGDIEVEWKDRAGNYDCELENGEVYRWDDTGEEKAA